MQKDRFARRSNDEHRAPRRPDAHSAGGPSVELSSKQLRAFKLAQGAARKVLTRRFRVLRLTKDAYLKLGEHAAPMARVKQDLGTMLRLARAWARREYGNVPWKALLYIVAAVVYFVNPIDLIPDVLTGIGFVDDAAVVGAVIRALHAELTAFRRWEEQQSLTSPARTIRPLPPASAAA